MLKTRWILAAAWLLLRGGGTLVSNASPPAGVSYIVDRWEDGLPQSSVIALTQTRDSYLWLGTLNGLARFDGLRFTVFEDQDIPGLNSSRIVHLYEDSQTNLWVSTDTADIALLKKDGSVARLKLGPGAGRLMSACEDASGAVWLYTTDGQVVRHRDGRMDTWRVGVPSSRCRALIAEAPDRLWVGTDSELYSFNPAASARSPELFLQRGPPAGKQDYLLASRNGGYWRLADGRVQKWKGSQLQRDWGPYPWNSQARVSTACEDREGNLVIGTYAVNDGVYWYDAGGNATHISSASEGLSHDGILSLCVDREGSLWVGTDGGGLNRVKRTAFKVSEEYLGWVMQSVCEDEQGGLWFGSYGGELGYWKDGVLQRFGGAQGLTNLYVRAAFVDRSQRVWVGTYGGGLFQLTNGLFQPAPGSQVIGREISAIHQDRSNQVWVGTQSGLARWDGREWKVFTTRDGLSANAVRAIADDRDGNVWIGTEGGGLTRLRNGQFTSFHTSNGLPSEKISSLRVDDENVLWVGTDGGGLARWQSGKWTSYTKRQGLISNRVGYLMEDGEGFLWIGSYKGLMRVPKKALNDFAHGATNAIPFRDYEKADGLPTSECTLGSQPAACRTREGTIWFPTSKGLVSLNPARLKPNTNPPPIVIEKVLVDGQEQNTNSLRAEWLPAVIIPAGKERLEIHYTSLNLAAPKRARFKYRMEGHETTWTEAGDRRVAPYTQLPPGHYRFQVMASNEDGVWNQNVSALAVKVLPPFWRKWWFLTAVALLLLGTIVAVVHYVSTQKLQRQLAGLRQQEALEKERSRIARDLHDQLGANLTQVALLGELAESDKAAPDEVEAHARQISQTARETTRALDEIVWAANPANDTLESLITYACKYAQEFLAMAGLRYRLDVPAQLPAATIPPEVRHNVFLAFKEAVNNVVKHSQATESRIRLHLQPNRFTLEIQDNGRGIAGLDPERARARNGLRNMRKRMEDVGGEFSIGPSPEGGTLVQLTAPLDKR